MKRASKPFALKMMIKMHVLYDTFDNKSFNLMKKITFYFFFFVIISCFVISCKSDEIGFYKEGYDAVRFPVNTLVSSEARGYNTQTGVFLAACSFIETPFISDTIYDLPVMLIGNRSDKERSIKYRIDEERSTAPTGSFNMLEAVLPPDSSVGYIRCQLYNREELNDTTYLLYFVLQETEELSAGPKEYITAMLSWNNAIPMPTNAFHIRTYNMLINSSLNFVSTSIQIYSPNALKTIVAALEWNDWDDYEKHGSKYNNPTTYGSYKYLPRYNMIYSDNSYKSYALKLAEYIRAYNEEHPDSPLRHDAGNLQGELIVARAY